MTTPTPLSELAARLRGVEKEATPRPWLLFDYEEGVRDQAYIEQDVSPRSQGLADPIVFSSCCEEEGDLKLIVELRNSLPTILLALEAVEEMERALTRIADHPTINTLVFVEERTDQPPSLITTGGEEFARAALAKLREARG